MPFLPLDEALVVARRRKAVPHQFVLDAIVALSPITRPMFGCLAVYVENKIVLILRDKRDETADNGVWLATTEDHHDSLRREFPNMRSIRALGKGVTGWQALPADAPDFEEAALRACERILAKDPESARFRGRGGPRDREHRKRQDPRTRRRPRNVVTGRDKQIETVAGGCIAARRAWITAHPEVIHISGAAPYG
jgi:hypothetical protein